MGVREVLLGSVVMKVLLLSVMMEEDVLLLSVMTEKEVLLLSVMMSIKSKA